MVERCKKKLSDFWIWLSLFEFRLNFTLGPTYDINIILLFFFVKLQPGTIIQCNKCWETFLATEFEEHFNSHHESAGGSSSDQVFKVFFILKIELKKL